MASEQIQELENRLVNAASRVEEIDALNALASKLIFENTERADQLAQRALHLSRSEEQAGQPYEKGMADSLSALGAIAKLHCDYHTALPRLLEARSLLETLSTNEPLIMVLRDLGWIYFNLGDLPQAIEILHYGLRIAREHKDTGSEARILNTLGAVYGESEEKEESIETLRRALKCLEETIEGDDDRRIQCLIYNNLAMTQFEMRAYDDALDSAGRSLEIARQLESPDLLATTLDTTGQVFLGKQEYKKAEDYFVQAQAYYQGEGNDPDEINLNLARAAIGQGRAEEAARLLNESLKSVEARGANRLSYQFHELLSGLYEEQADLARAIEHYKCFHALKSQVYNEETQRRFVNLIVTHQAETTRIDAEIIRLKNRSLHQEISDQRQMVAEMEILATTDDLTGLLNRRHFMTLSDYAFELARTTNQPLSALMMDIDDFKKVNDRYGHLAGDRVLLGVSAVIRANLRKDDLIGRYGGEEFVAVLPKTGIFAIQKVADRVLKKVEQWSTFEGTQKMQVTLSIGVAQASPSDENLESLLKRADQALYAAKRAGKNQVMTAWASEP